MAVQNLQQQPWEGNFSLSCLVFWSLKIYLLFLGFVLTQIDKNDAQCDCKKKIHVYFIHLKGEILIPFTHQMIICLIITAPIKNIIIIIATIIYIHFSFFNTLYKIMQILFISQKSIQDEVQYLIPSLSRSIINQQTNCD